MKVEMIKYPKMEDWLLDAGTSTVLASGGPWKLGVGGPFKGRTKLKRVNTVIFNSISISHYLTMLESLD